MDRRSALAAVGGSAALVSTASLLGGCAEDSSGSRSDDNSAVELPTFVAYDGVKPNFPADENGTMAAYLQYPAKSEQTAVYDGPPAAGGTITALSHTDGAAPPAVDRNRYWQELNKRLGTEFQITMSPPGDYNAKLATALASGDLPDMVQILPHGLPNLPDALAAEFQDLSDYLAGDAVKKYPGLANIPPQSWRNTVHNGGIFAIPIHRGVIGSIFLTRHDLLAAKGVTEDIRNGEDFLELCRELTDPRQNKWATAGPLGVIDFVLAMLDGPSVWAEENGKFTHKYETDAMTKALEVVAGMWREGVFHPDSFGSSPPVNEWISSGTVSMIRVGYGSWMGWQRDIKPHNPNLVVGAVPVVGFDGGPARNFAGNGIYSITAFKKSSKSRIEELLRVADWLAAPFGTKEQTFIDYGIEGYSHTLEGTDPVYTETGRAERPVPVQYLSNCAHVLYFAGASEAVEDEYHYQKKTLTDAKSNPADGLYSATAAREQGQLDKKIADLQSSVIQGRRNLAEWKQGVEDWKRNGGDAMRTEYQAAFASSK